MAASERDERARARWRERVASIDPGRLVFVDECGAHIGLAPLRARAPKGERAFGGAPRNRGKNTTLLAGMGPGGMGPCLAVEGGTTKAVFKAYVEWVLAPSLRPGQVVVLDNLQAHKGERVRRAVEQRGAELVSLPPYSPDFSPIEEAFGKLKTLLRREKARTKEALVEAIGRALDAITPEDAEGWFAGGPDDDPAIHYDLAEHKHGDVTRPTGWEAHDLKISKDTIPDLVTDPRGTLIAMGCGAGREPLARAFLEAGYEGYVGATEEYVDGDSAFVFTVNLFYHLMAEDRDYQRKAYTVAEAVERAALTDPDFDVGTRPYRYWGPRDFDESSGSVDTEVPRAGR